MALAILLCAGGSMSASAADESREADHVALRALRDKVTTAIDKQDIKALASCFAKEFAFTAVNQTVLTNEAQVQEFFDRMFRSSDAPACQPEDRAKGGYPDSLCRCQHGELLRKLQRYLHAEIGEGRGDECALECHGSEGEWRVESGAWLTWGRTFLIIQYWRG